jgi:hypothetical protein
VLPFAALAVGADQGREPATKASPGARTPASARGTPAGKVLPDPALLDGSNQPAEKKSEYGMIGDFELPGDENAPRNGKVGGGAGGRGGGTEEGPGGPSIKVTPPGLPLPGVGLPLPGQSGAGGGAGGIGLPNQGQGAGGGAPGVGLPNQGEGGGAAANPAAATGQQGGGAAGGTQVGSLGGVGDPSTGGDALGDRPKPVVIGDAAMRIPNSTAGVGASVGQVPASANTQNYEKGTGSGGKASGQAGSPNRAEKGRPIPAGL